MRDEHFRKVFWFCVMVTIIALAYVFLITFFVIPEKNMRHADTALGFLLGTLVSSSIGYLMGGSPTMQSKKPPAQEEGTTTAEISANIRTRPKKTKETKEPEK